MPPPVRRALQAWHEADAKPQFMLTRFLPTIIAVTWSGPAAVMIRGLPFRVAEAAKGLHASAVKEFDGTSVWAWGFNFFAVFMFALMLFFMGALTAAIALGPIAWAYLTLRDVVPADLAERRRYHLVQMLSGVIRVCAESREAQGEARTALLEQKLFGQLANVEPYILRAHLTRRPYSVIPTHRRHALKKHGRLVVARLRKALDSIDHDPDGALKELAGLLLTVQARYGEGRTGALLDREDTRDIADELKEFEPAQSREVLRLVVASVLTVGGVVGIAQLDLPDMAEGPAVLLVAIVASALVYRVPWRVEERAAFIAGA